MGFAILIVCSMIAASLAGPRGLNATPPSNERGLHYVNTSSEPMEEILLHTDNVEAATAEIESVGGRVTLLFADKVLVAKVPREFIAKKNSFASATAHISEAAAASPEIMTYVQAYWRARAKKTQPQPLVQRWNEKTAPMVLPRDAVTDRYPSPKTMSGKIAVALVIVSGPGNLAISQSEKDLIVSEVTAGLKFWSDTAPAYAQLSFDLFTMHPSVNAPDTGSHIPYRDAALNHCGFPSGTSGTNAMADYFKLVGAADGAYVAFFTKYQQFHFAFALLGGGPIYIQYSNGNWGKDQIDRVFAHETGHIFFAPDEYGDCNRGANYGKGTCHTKNYNCISCPSPDSKVPCIMDKNTFEVCRFTEAHIGWCG